MDKKVIGGKKKIFSRFFIIISLSQYRYTSIYLSIYLYQGGNGGHIRAGRRGQQRQGHQERGCRHPST